MYPVRGRGQPCIACASCISHTIDCCCRPKSTSFRRPWTSPHNQLNLRPGRHFDEALVVSLRPAILNRNGAALNSTGVAQSRDRGRKAWDIVQTRVGAKIRRVDASDWGLRGTPASNRGAL
jgi:hypothetical protein